MRGYTGRKDDEGIILRDGERITTNDAFAPPVKFRIVAETNSTNIRFAYAADEIILNWEVDRSELRIGGGPAGGRHKMGVGRIPTDQFVEIELNVLPDSLSISVDGDLRYQTNADFSQVREPLSIFQGAGSTIKVKSVTVEKRTN